jgi:hypothetical protein
LGYGASSIDISKLLFIPNGENSNHLSCLLEKFYFEAYLFCVSGIMIDIFPSWFRGSRIKLTIDKIVSMFAHECYKEHHEVETFINELLQEEQKNMIRELTIEVHQLSKVIKGVLFQRHNLNGITTRGRLV